MTAHARPYDFAEAKAAINTAKAQMLAAEQNVRDAATKYASAEASYRKALAKKILELHADGIAWSSTADIARGDEHVAGLRYERDVAEGVKQAAESAIWRFVADRKDLAALVNWSLRVAPDGQHEDYDRPRAVA